MNKHNIPRGDSSFEYLLFIVFAVSICSLLNILYLISVAASPIVNEDGWYFLASQIHPWVDRGFTWTDIFIKRGLTDHAQPLHRLALFFNYKLFNLDFRYEALAGFLGVLSAVFLFLSLFVKRFIGQSLAWPSAGSFVLAILIFTSLNSRELYSWSLVTFSYASLFLTFLLPLLAWRFLNYQLNIASIIFTALIFVLVGDTASIISWLSLTVSIVLVSISDREINRMRVLLWIMSSALIVAVYFLIVNINFIGGNIAGSATSNKLDLLSINFYLELVRVVFSSSLVHAEHLVGAGKYQYLLSWLIAVPVLFFYLHHFFALVFKNRRQTSVDFFVTFILVYATFSVAAIVVGRVPQYGVDYLHQPRYVLVYQLIPFALMMKYCFLPSVEKSHVIIHKTIVLIGLPVMLCAQFYFSANAHAAVPWISKWLDGQSKAITNYVNHPDLPAGNCTNFSSTICNFSEPERNELLNLLIKNRLNIFNHEFQWKYRIFPSIEIKAPDVSAWGPQVISVQSSDGVWIKLSSPIVNAEVKVQVRVNDKSITHVVFTGEVITFYLPEEHRSFPGIYRIEYSVDDWGSSVLVGDIEVTN